MEKINTLNVSRLRTAGHLGYHKAAYQEFRVAGLTTNTGYTALVAQYVAAISTEEEVVRRQQALLLTADVTEADAARDSTLRQLVTLVDSAQYSTLAAEKQAADKLAIVIKPYRKDYKDNMAEETEDLRGLLAILGQDDMAGYIDQLTLGPVMQRLRQQNNAFDTLYRQRAQERVTTRGTGISTKDQRKVVDDLYRQLVDMVNAIVGTAALGIETGFDATLLGTLTSNVNGVIEQYKLVIANQNKTSAAGGGEEAEEEE